MYRNICLVCGKNTLGEDFCSPEHEAKYTRDIRPANTIPELDSQEKEYRAELLDTFFNASGPERVEAARRLSLYGLTVVGRKDRVYHLEKVIQGVE